MKGLPRGPVVKIAVTQQQVKDAIRANSGHCMIAEAIIATVPNVDENTVSVDLQTIRFTDKKKGLRYVYLTPRNAQATLVEFDQGIDPEPPTFTLRNAHVLRAGRSERQKKYYAKQKKAGALPKRAKLVSGEHGRKSGHAGGGENVPRVVGGKEPPRSGVRREFGLRAYRGSRLERAAIEAAKQGAQG